MESINDKLSKNSKLWFTYFVKCKDGSLYAGVTTDIKRRLRQHNGEIKGGAKYTQSKRPVKMVYIEPHFNRVMCSKKEYVIRKLSRINKDKLIISNHNFLNTFFS